MLGTALGQLALILAQSEIEGVGSYVDVVERAGLLGGAILIIWAFLTERLVPGSAHRRMLAESEERYRNMRDITSATLDRLERAVEALRNQS